MCIIIHPNSIFAFTRMTDGNRVHSFTKATSEQSFPLSHLFCAPFYFVENSSSRKYFAAIFLCSFPKAEACPYCKGLHMPLIYSDFSEKNK